MSARELQVGASLLSAFASIIGGALGVDLPMTLVIIWVCS
jgi:shikimate kinase